MNASAREPVVVGLDRSDPGRAAVEYAAQLANREHLPLRLVHVYEQRPYGRVPSERFSQHVGTVLQNSARRLLDETVEVLGVVYPELEVHGVLEQGEPAAVLLEQAKHARTLVVGSRGTGGFADLLVGSTALHVAAHAACPMVAVPSPADADADRRGVIVGVDGSESSAAIGYAFENAAELGEPLTAIHAWHDPTRTGVGTMMPLGYDPAVVVQEERAVLADAMSSWQEKFPDVQLEQKVVLGHAVPALVSRAGTARLLVVGCRGRGALRSLVLGSVSHGILHHATGPVAVVHQH